MGVIGDFIENTNGERGVRGTMVGSGSPVTGFGTGVGTKGLGRTKVGAGEVR